MRINDRDTISRTNFRRLVSEVGGDKKELARRTGIPLTRLYHVDSEDENAPPFRNIGKKMARRLETGMGKPLGWMDQDHSSALEETGNKPIPMARLISWAQVGRLDEEMDSHVSVDTDATVVYNVDTSTVDESAFALRVRGDSMVDNAGSPSFPDGCIIVVDPSITAMPGDNVVVRLPAVEEAVFKTLELFDGKLQLKPLNSRYPIAPMPEGARIIGVVVQVTTTIVPRARR
jgi:SOS-response transcriptional repressor LexA